MLKSQELGSMQGKSDWIWIRISWILTVQSDQISIVKLGVCIILKVIGINRQSKKWLTFENYLLIKKNIV